MEYTVYGFYPDTLGDTTGLTDAHYDLFAQIGDEEIEKAGLTEEVGGVHMGWDAGQFTYPPPIGKDHELDALFDRIYDRFYQEYTSIPLAAK